MAYLLPGPIRDGRVAFICAITVAVFEIGLAASLLLWGARRGLLLLASGALVVFSVVLVLLAFAAGAPGCGCLGPLRSTDTTRDALLGLIRNASLAAVLGWLWRFGACRGLDREYASSRHAPSSLQMRSRNRGGFTVIELLVVVCLTAIVTALSLAALGPAREASRNSREVQMARQLCAATNLYCEDYREVYPYFATPGDPFGRISLHGAELPRLYFRSQRWYWASLIVPEYARVARQAIEPAGRADYLQQVAGLPEGVIASSFQLTSTAFAAPAYWRDGSSDWDKPEHYRATRMGEVLYPSLKGLLLGSITGSGGHAGQRVFPVGMADGSATGRTLEEFARGQAVDRPHGSAGFPVEATLDGLAGRDF